MAEIILYITSTDSQSILEWINKEDEIAWIVNDSRKGNSYRWVAKRKIDSLKSREYCLWRIGTGPLRIPSGSNETPDTEILDPFAGWEQILDTEEATRPWFGSASPETFVFTFREHGRKGKKAMGRSGFTWIGNYFSSIGNPAPMECEKWWNKLKRYVKKNAIGVPWPGPIGSGKAGSYAFPEAFSLLESGKPRDINP